MTALEQLYYLIGRLESLREKGEVKSTDLDFVRSILKENEYFTEEDSSAFKDDKYESDNDDDLDYLPYEDTYDDYGDSEVCGACQESPCMCSDRERTSTIHDF